MFGLIAGTLFLAFLVESSRQGTRAKNGNVSDYRTGSSGASLRPTSVLRIYSVGAYVSRMKHRGVSAPYDAVQDLVEGVKMGDSRANAYAAELLAAHPGLQGFDGIIVPAPRSTPANVPLLELASALVRAGVGTRAVAAVKRATPVPSSRLLRRAGRPDVSRHQHLQSMAVVDPLPPTAPILLLDDMVTRGNTLLAVRRVLREAGHTGPILAATVGWWTPSPTDGPADPLTPVQLRVDWEGSPERFAGQSAVLASTP